MVETLPNLVRLRRRSLARGLLLTLGAFVASLLLAGFPYIERLHGSRWQIACLLAGLWGMVETGRCLERRWSLYHAGVLILLYSDLVILAMITFVVFYE